MVRCIGALLVPGNGKHCTGVFFPTAAYSLYVFYTKFPINCVSLRPGDFVFTFAYNFFPQFPQKRWPTEHTHPKITLHNNSTHICPLHQYSPVRHLLFTSRKTPPLSTPQLCIFKFPSFPIMGPFFFSTHDGNWMWKTNRLLILQQHKWDLEVDKIEDNNEKIRHAVSVCGLLLLQ